MNEHLEAEVDDGLTSHGGIPMIWDRGRKGDDLKSHHDWLEAGMNYWDEMRETLRAMFRTNRQKFADLDRADFAASAAYSIGYERALQDVYKNLPRPRERKQ